MSAFGTLASEALRDAIRRRIVAAILVLSVLSLMLVDSCTGCAAGEIVVNGEPRSFDQVAGASGVVLFVTLALWIVVLAGVLASDHLQQTLEDGSANLSLARPVSRRTFALSRLTGALAVALGAGVILLGTTAALLSVRSGLSLGPAFLAGLCCILGALLVSAFAMALSLHLPRLATILLVFGAVGTAVAANFVALLQQGKGTGVLAWIDRLGPPLATSLVAALDPWIEQVAIGLDPVAMVTRLATWSVAALALLIWRFSRIELGR